MSGSGVFHNVSSGKDNILPFSIEDIIEGGNLNFNISFEGLETKGGQSPAGGVKVRMGAKDNERSQGE
jgi:hypothetical protein